jgi:hypothetical protein
VAWDDDVRSAKGIRDRRKRDRLCVLCLCGWGGLIVCAIFRPLQPCWSPISAKPCEYGVEPQYSRVMPSTSRVASSRVRRRSYC